MNEQAKPTKTIAEKEKDIALFWKEHKIFEKTLSRILPDGTLKPAYTFYDGPPFATGIPHHGHILAGTMKDIIPRYRTMKGDYVRRVWGWDCHGLPVENLIEKELGLGHKQEIENYGVGAFNQACQDSVMRYKEEWEKVVPRIGRFVDMGHAYKTMDASYTESIWWSWKELYEKKLAYEGYKIMHVCPRCETTLAQSEVAQGYKDVTDISVTVRFKKNDEDDTYFLAWTTTPWTLPGNTALALNAEADYSYVNSEDKTYIVATTRVEHLFKDKPYTLVKTVKGAELAGAQYQPVFSYFLDDVLDNKERIYTVWTADFVTLDTGTGIVHIAPAFGEDDMTLAKKEKIPVITHVKKDGTFVEQVTDFQGLYVKKVNDTQSTDIEIIKHLAHVGLLFAKEKLVHSYPHCWRCDTPLLNYATSSWFVDVPAIRDTMVLANKGVNWVPEHVKDGRFGKWLENAREWAVSRTRYWGAPLPVWKSPSGKVKVLGSYAELRSLVPGAKNKYLAMRHGESTSNVANVLDSALDSTIELTEKGVEQVKAVIEEIRAKGVTKIITSPLLRTKQTARILADALQLEAQEDVRLREASHGVWNGKTIEEFYAANPEYKVELAYAPQGGESHTDIRARMMQVLFECEEKYSGETILFVTHKGPLWMLLTGAEMLNDSETFTYLESKTHNRDGGYKFLNAHVYEVDFKPFPQQNGVLNVHRPYIDEVKFVIDDEEYTRIPDVFDCWYESGSMPYAEIHYPFENKDLFRERMPAQWIGEGLDQTRGWFYTLTVLGVALFGKIPFQNVIVNGLVMAEDGQKMSKSKKNFTDPMELVEKYGADALRLYMIASPLVQAENLSFFDKELEELYRRVFVRIENVLSLYELTQKEGDSIAQVPASTHPLDEWIIARTHEAHARVTAGLESYELNVAFAPVEDLVDDMSVWYVRRSRERLKGETGEEDRLHARTTLAYVIRELAKMFAPCAPFITERMYAVAGGTRESVHLETWSDVRSYDQAILDTMQKTRAIVSAALDIRTKNSIKVRQPLARLSVRDAVPESHKSIIQDELNVKEVVHNKDLAELVALDLHITAELQEEGYARECVRVIQDMRKAAGFVVGDMLTLIVTTTDENTKVFFRNNEVMLQKSCGLKTITFIAEEGSTHVFGEYVCTLALE